MGLAVVSFSRREQWAHFGLCSSTEFYSSRFRTSFLSSALAADIQRSLGTSPYEMSRGAVLTVSLGSGVVFGVEDVTMSQQADGLLSNVNRSGAGGDWARRVLTSTLQEQKRHE